MELHQKSSEMAELCLGNMLSGPDSRGCDIFRSLFENLTLGVCLADAECNLMAVNLSAKSLFGPGEPITAGAKCPLFRHVEAGICAHCRTGETSAGIGAESGEVEIQVDDRILRILFMPLSGTKEPPGRVLLVEDITRRKGHEERLRRSVIAAEQSRDTLESILQSVSDGLIVADESGRIVLMNSAAERLLLVRQKNLFAESLEDIIRDRRLLKHMRASLAGEAPGVCDIDLGGDGRIHPISLQIRTTLVANSEGDSVGIAFLLRDMTHEREIDRMKSEFISTAAHELRTPLTTIMGFSELLLERQLAPEQQKDFLTFIHHKAENLARIISDLLDISRIEAGRGLELHREPCDIKRLVEETLPDCRKISVRHQLELSLPDEPLIVLADRGKIIQVFENLLSNALKYSPAGGDIRVSATLIKGGLEFSVEDSGIGMTREEAARAFEKFYRSDNSNNAVEGTGLGLSISRYIVEAHGGRIWIRSRKGKGTTVFFTLPLTAQDFGNNIPES
jgi:PAS domain S-box-containing protein